MILDVTLLLELLVQIQYALLLHAIGVWCLSTCYNLRYFNVLFVDVF